MTYPNLIVYHPFMPLFRLIVITSLFCFCYLPSTVSAATVYVYQTPSGSKLITNSPTKKKGLKLLKIYEPVASIRSLPSGSRSNTKQSSAARNVKPTSSAYDAIINRLASEYEQDSALIKAIVHIESSFNAYAVSPKGALGLMQLMPGTAQRFEVDDPFDPKDNITGGTQYFSLLMQRYNNDVRKALAAYNAGETAVDSYNGIPPYPETQSYVKSVLKLHRRYQDHKIKTESPPSALNAGQQELNI